MKNTLIKFLQTLWEKDFLIKLALALVIIYLLQQIFKVPPDTGAL